MKDATPGSGVFLGLVSAHGYTPLPFSSIQVMITLRT